MAERKMSLGQSGFSADIPRGNEPVLEVSLLKAFKIEVAPAFAPQLGKTVVAQLAPTSEPGLMAKVGDQDSQAEGARV
jgi:hypothetical protein